MNCFYFFLFLSCSLWGEIKELGVVYEFSGGRFGDNLLSYLHAKWFAYQHQIPLYYEPFPFSSDLVLDDREPLLYRFFPKKPFVWHNISNGLPDPRITLPILYICPYAPENQQELTDPAPSHWINYKVDWKDPEFRMIIKEMITPKISLDLIEPLPYAINIALHVREGGGYDSFLDLNKGTPFFSLKFPPLDFYVHGLKKIFRLFPDKVYRCHLFTDASSPKAIVEKIKERLPTDIPITFSCREQQNYPNQNVLEDFFSFFLFDILIHPQSNYSIIPALIHDFAVVFSPMESIIQEGHIEITETKIEINEELCQKLMKYPQVN